MAKFVGLIGNFWWGNYVISNFDEFRLQESVSCFELQRKYQVQEVKLSGYITNYQKNILEGIFAK